MNAEFWPGMQQVFAWTIAGIWCVKTTDFLRGFPTIADLAQPAGDVWPQTMPSLCVVVPARDEAAKVAATLDTLMQQDYPAMRVVAVNDRSTDETGAIMDRFAAAYPERVSVLHITELRDGWLGKTNAMDYAVKLSAGWDGGSDYVLFTDADVLFSPSVLRRSIAYAERERADHLVTMPTMLVKSPGEGVVLGFFQMMPVWASRLWRVADERSPRDVVGIGAFNLVRREALTAIGGLEPQRMVVLEDVILGVRMKGAGLRQRVAFAPGLVLVHWAEGLGGLIRGLTKNLFSLSNFNPLMAVGVFGWIGVCFLAPLAMLLWWKTAVPGLLVLACIGLVYRMYGEKSLTPARYFWTYPLGAVLFCYAVLRSVIVVLWEGGVRWRGTLYPLRELRKHNSPFAWRRAAR